VGIIKVIIIIIIIIVFASDVGVVWWGSGGGGRERQPSTCSWHRLTLSFQLQLKPSGQ